MALNRNLQAWSRVDGHGRIVPGSTVLRLNKPKIGTWELNKTYQCCNTITLTYIVPNPTINSIDFILQCGTTPVFVNYTGQSSSVAQDVIDVLNNYVVGQFPAFGVFSTPDNTATSNVVVNLTMSTDLANIFCSYKNGLSFIVVSAD